MPDSRPDAPLTPFRKRFCEEYIIDLNGADAVRRAGSTTKYPDRYAYEMLRNEKVINYISQLMTARAKQTSFNAKWVLLQLAIQYQKADASAGLGKESKPAERAQALRALENMGKHVDVNAFRQQFGVGNLDGTNFDWSKLSDDELELAATIFRKAGISTGDEPQGD